MMSMRSLAPALAALAALTLAIPPAAAQKKGQVTTASGSESTSRSNSEVITSISVGDLRSLLSDMGYEPRSLEGQDNAWAVQMADRPVLVRVGSEGKNLLLWTYVQGGSLDKVNQWNKEKRFSRAYLDGDGDANVEWDIDLEGGVTVEAVREGIRTFQSVVQIFKDFGF
jgi:hypothetical protein